MGSRVKVLVGKFGREKNWKRRWKGEKVGRRIFGMMAAFMLVVSLAGCGNLGGDGAGSGTARDGSGEDSGEEELSGAMGRYVEEVTDLSAKISGSGNRIYWLDNGNLVISDSISDFVKADGDAAVWMADIRRWRTRMMEEGTYIMSMAVGADNTVALIYQGDEEESGADSGDEDTAGTDTGKEEEPETDSGEEDTAGTDMGKEEEPETDSGEENAAGADVGEEDAGTGDADGTNEQEEEQIELNPKLMIIKPDNTEIPVDVAITEDDKYLDQVYIADDGRIFVSTRGTSNVYEVKEDGDSELFLMVEEGHPDLIRFHGNIMAIDGYGYDGLLLYDMDKGEYIEDDVLDEFINENYKDRGKGSLDSYDLYFFFDEDDIIYLAGEKGLYRHVIGGSAMEQVIDGKLCSLGNPAYELQGMVSLDNSEFLALFQGGQLVRYVYDPDIPTVPHEKLTVYGLYDNELIRQAINIYQARNPEVYIEFTCGISGNNSVTKEDALKSLNTKIMAGEGPDILLLDNMPTDSYIEKGLLLDLSQILDSLNGEEELFGNIVDAVKTGDQIYAVPSEVRLPIMMTDTKYLSGVNDLADIADMTEALREDYPEQDLLGISSEKGIMRLFAMTCAPAWMNADGEINREALQEFLEQTKRIYEAQTEGVSDRVFERYEEVGQAYEMYNKVASFEDSDYLRMPGIVELKYVGGYTKSLFGVFRCMDINSIPKINGFEDVIWRPMGGQCENIFWARTLLGINAASKQIQLAEDFLKVCLGKENQSYLYDSLPVNKAAFDESFIVSGNLLDSSGMYSSVATEGEEGQMVVLIHYWPTEEEIAEYRKYMETADTAYIENDILENAVYEEGIAYIQGTKSLEDAVNDIEKKVSIYMAE